MNGVQVRPPKMAQFNNGNMPYKLLIKSNTIISNMKIFDPISYLDTLPESIELCDVLNTTKRISKYSFIIFINNFFIIFIYYTLQFKIS